MFHDEGMKPMDLEEQESRALAEVYSFLQRCHAEVIEKIPQNLMDYLADNKMEGVHITKIEELSREAQGIIALFNLAYLIPPEEKEAHHLILIKNELVDLLKTLREQNGDEDILQMQELVEKAETKEELSPFLKMFDLESAFEDLEKEVEEFRQMFL
jgi:hypothetical protein